MPENDFYESGTNGLSSDTDSNASNASNTFKSNNSQGETNMTNTTNNTNNNNAAAILAQFEELQSSLAMMFAQAPVHAAPTQEEREAKREERKAERIAKIEAGEQISSWVLDWDLDKIVGTSIAGTIKLIEDGRIDFIEPGSVGHNEYRNQGNVILSNGQSDRFAQYDLMGRAIGLYLADIYTIGQGDPGTAVLVNKHNGHEIVLVVKEYTDYRGNTDIRVDTHEYVTKTMARFGKVVTTKQLSNKLMEGHEAYRAKAYRHNQIKQKDTAFRNVNAPYKYEMLYALLDGKNIGISTKNFKEVGQGYMRQTVASFSNWGIISELAWRAEMSTVVNGNVVLKPEVAAKVGMSPWTAMHLRNEERKAQAETTGLEG